MKWLGIIGKEIIISLIKLDVSVKITLTSLFSLYPYWFISIYLFSENFYHNNPLWITIAIAFCLTLVWHFTILQYTVLVSEFTIVKKENDNNGFLVINLINSMSLISLFMFIAYSNHWSFYKFTTWSFLFLLVCVIILAISHGISKAIKYEKSTTLSHEKQKSLKNPNKQMLESSKKDENTVQQEKN